MATHWVRFSQAGRIRFGTLEGGRVRVHRGDMFADPVATGITHALSDVRLLMPTRPSKVIALWNNFRALGQRLKLTEPAEPLYLIKAPNSYLDPGATIRAPRGGGKVAFEGELGIVVGKTCKEVGEHSAMGHVFGYTCANDVTMADILHRDPSFAQWSRAKGFDTFCPFGPAVATGIEPHQLKVRTTLNGELRQDYPISDMIFPVPRLMSLISRDMTLHPGDIILCGTSLGVGSMKPGSDVEVDIDGIGKLANRFE
jgi:2-keto-4-pentenoate hydratase/2-oxohepta-3-ene-1,7-dioic acid hydratase in catechol pathway